MINVLIDSHLGVSKLAFCRNSKMEEFKKKLMDLNVLFETRSDLLTDLKNFLNSIHYFPLKRDLAVSA